MRLAIIDLGTNSVRFDIYDLSKDALRDRIYRDKRMIRLGDGAFYENRLQKQAMARTLRAFESFHKKIKGYDVDKVIAFATSALRDTTNSQALISEIQKRTGIHIRVISGRREAQFIAQGVLRNDALPHGLFGLMDIGGGSCEISICYGRTALRSISLPLGANRLQQIFLKSHPPRARGEIGDPVMKLRRHIRKSLARAISEQRRPRIKTFIGSSGTIRAYRKILKTRGEKTEPFRLSSLTQLIEEMIPLTKAELMNIPGMTVKRADIILAGGILLEELATQFDAKYIYTTDTCLRDGIIERESQRFFMNYIDLLGV